MVSQKVVVISVSCLILVQDYERGKKKETQKGVNINHRQVANYARRFPRGRWSFLGPGSENKWYGTYSDKPDGAWDKTAEQMMLNFAGTSHPMCSVSTEQ